MTKVSELVSQNVASALTSLQTWGGIVVSVKAYGAKGNWNTVTSTGTDDTVSIQASIDYAISIGKKEVYFPTGTYKYTVLTNTAGMTFIGDGVTLVGTTLLKLTSFSARDFGFSKWSEIILKMMNGLAIKIVCYGDSITFGFNPVGGGQVVNPYPLALQTKLRAVYRNNNITVVNKGNSGWNTNDGLVNLKAQVLDLIPDAVIIMFGINDAKWATYSVDTYKSNLSLIVGGCAKKGIEVALMSPTPIIEELSNGNKKLLTYAGAMEEVAISTGVDFIPMHKKITDLFFRRAEAPNVMFPDNVHFKDDKYAVIADIALNQMIGDAPTDVLIVNESEMYIPVVYSNYIQSDITSTLSNNGQFQLRNYILKSNGTTGTYLRLNFYVPRNGMDLAVRCPKGPNGGQIAVKDNGVTIKTVDCYSRETLVYDSEDILLENMAQGYHVIEYLSSAAVVGQSTGGVGEIYITEFVFRVTKAKTDRRYNTTGGALATLEMYRRVNEGSIKFRNTAGGNTGVILESGGAAEIRTGKTLMIEIEGIFVSGSGFSFFGNKAQAFTPSDNQSNANAGYLLYFDTSAYLFSFGQNNVFGTALISAALALTYTNVQKFRVTVTDTGLITLFANGTQIFQFTDTRAKNGYFGLYSSNVSVLEISRYEYAYS